MKVHGRPMSDQTPPQQCPARTVKESSDSITRRVALSKQLAKNLETNEIPQGR